MATKHATEAVTVAELLGGRRLFGVPQYQRPYAWRKREADQLISDLLGELEAIAETGDQDRNYYLGLAVIIDNTPPRRAMRGFRRGSAPPSEIVDGKQRLTTLTMLIAILRDLLGAQGVGLESYLTETGPSRQWPKATPRLLLEGPEQDFLTAHVLPPGATAVRVPKDAAHEGVRRLREVRDYLRGELKDQPASTLHALASMLLERCELTVIVPKDIASGYRIFVSVNFRGKQLSTTDIVKADLFGQIEPGERNKLNQRWLALEARLEPHPEDQDKARRAASFDNLMSYVHKLRCRHGTTVFQGIAELAAATGDPRDFITDVLEPFGDILLEVKRASHSGSPASLGINRVLTTLNWLSANDWVPIAMASLHGNGRRPEEALSQLALLQRLAYALQILGRGGSQRDNRIRGTLRAISEGKSTQDQDHPLMLTSDEDDSVARLIASGLYRKGGVSKPMLAIIAAADGASAMQASLDGYTVEHLLPQTAADHPYWREHFPDVRIRDAACRSLGNLALVSKRQNGRCKNLPFPEKRAILFEGGFVSPFDTTRMLKDIADWTPEAVLEREVMMYKRIAKAWDLKAANRSKLAAVLKL